MDFLYDDELINHEYFPEEKEVLVIAVFNNLQNVGYIHYQIKDETLYIEKIEVEEPFRKMGYANLLLKEVKELYPFLKYAEGQSILISIPFWEKKRATFYEKINKGLYDLYPFKYVL